MSPRKLLESLGRFLLVGVRELGELLLFTQSFFGWLFAPPFRRDVFFRQMEFIGVRSLPIIALTGTFTGMVFGLQTGYAFRQFNAQIFVGSTVGLALTREIGPVFTALMVAARAGSAMAAEIGTMKVTEQVDALSAMAINPMHYLVVPRVIASALMLPLLAGIFSFIGIAGAYFVAVHLLHIGPTVFIQKLTYYVDADDVIGGLIKAAFFGAVLGLVSCQRGYRTSGGAEGVGRSTTQAVVISSVAILVLDYFLTSWILELFPGMGDAVIRFEDVYKSFSGHPVLKGLNLELPKGKISVILGPSGEGKSVLLKHMIGLIRPDRGRVVVDDTDLSTLDDRAINDFRKKFGMLFQNAALFDSFNVGDNVAFPLREHTKLSEREIAERVRQKLDLVGLKAALDKMPSELSGGMRKRVGLARAIALEPGIILYDEPTTGLDPLMTDTINHLIVETQKKLGVTSVIISHDIEATFQVADFVAMLHGGVIIESGDPKSFQRSAHPFVRKFLERRGSES